MIGFKNTNNKLAVQEEPAVSTNLPDVEELIRMKGMHEAQKVLQEYLSPFFYPLLRDQERDVFFMKRLRKIRERYFEIL